MFSSPSRAIAPPSAAHVSTSSVSTLTFPARLNLPGREEFSSMLTLKVTPTQDAFSRSELVLELTDASDWLFLQVAKLSEADFHEMKVEQRLLVEFKGLSEMLRRLVEKGVSVLFTGSMLVFSEVSEFRELVHFTLPLIRASESQLRQHLSNCLTAVNAELLATSQALEDASAETARWRAQFTQASTDLRDQQARHDRQLSELRMQTANEELKKQAEYKESVTKIKETYEARIYDIKLEFDEHQKSLQAELAQVHIEKNECINAGNLANSRINILEEEKKEISNQFHEISKQSDIQKLKLVQITSELTALKEELSKSQTALTVAAENAKNYIQLNHKQENIITQLREQKTSLEKTNSAQEEQIKALQNELAHIKEMLGKIEKEKSANDVTVKMLKSKNKVKIAALMQQEKVVADLEKKVNSLEAGISEKAKTLDAFSDDKKKLESDVAGFKKKLEEAHALIASNEQLIAYLNKQVLGGGLPAGNTGNTEITSRLKSLVATPAASSTVAPIPLKTATKMTGNFPDFPVRSVTNDFANPYVEQVSPTKVAGPVRFTPRVREQ